MTAPVNGTPLANKADTARIRSEVDMIVPSKVGCAELFSDTTTGPNLCLTNTECQQQGAGLRSRALSLTGRKLVGHQRRCPFQADRA